MLPEGSAAGGGGAALEVAVPSSGPSGPSAHDGHLASPADSRCRGRRRRRRCRRSSSTATAAGSTSSACLSTVLMATSFSCAVLGRPAAARREERAVCDGFASAADCRAIVDGCRRESWYSGLEAYASCIADDNSGPVVAALREEAAAALAEWFPGVGALRPIVTVLTRSNGCRQVRPHLTPNASPSFLTLVTTGLGASSRSALRHRPQADRQQEVQGRAVRAGHRGLCRSSRAGGPCHLI